MKRPARFWKPGRSKNKYRNETFRAQWWDYSRNGAYYIIIYTQNTECYFGGIKNFEMHLTEMGKFAENFWLEIPHHFTNIILDAFIVIPNHVHGILIIDKPDCPGGFVGTPKLGVPTAETTINIENSGELPSNRWLPQSIGVIVNQYKRICTIHARKINNGFAWQPNYHDHIIRNNHEFLLIRDFILNNPANWGKDKFYL